MSAERFNETKLPPLGPFFKNSLNFIEGVLLFSCNAMRGKKNINLSCLVDLFFSFTVSPSALLINCACFFLLLSLRPWSMASLISPALWPLTPNCNWWPLEQSQEPSKCILFLSGFFFFFARTYWPGFKERQFLTDQNWPVQLIFWCSFAVILCSPVIKAWSVPD